jgi:hypothetical protein
VRGSRCREMRPIRPRQGRRRVSGAGRRQSASIRSPADRRAEFPALGAGNSPRTGSGTADSGFPALRGVDGRLAPNRCPITQGRSCGGTAHGTAAAGNGERGSCCREMRPVRPRQGQRRVPGAGRRQSASIRSPADRRAEFPALGAGNSPRTGSGTADSGFPALRGVDDRPALRGVDDRPARGVDDRTGDRPRGGRAPGYRPRTPAAHPAPRPFEAALAGRRPDRENP